MNAKSVVITLALGAALCFWNLKELPSFQVDTDQVNTLEIPDSIEVPNLDWSWFDEVEVKVRAGECILVSLPDVLHQLDGKEVVVAGPSFACGDDLVEHKDGYTIKGFIMVPYFGMIDCCVGNPVPYFQWTIVVDRLQTPWKIPHKGVIDPDVIVRGRLRIERSATQEGVFWLDDANIIQSKESDRWEAL